MADFYHKRVLYSLRHNLGNPSHLPVEYETKDLELLRSELGISKVVPSVFELGLRSRIENDT